MPYATKSQIERARQPDLLTFLRRYKPDELIPTGPNAYKLRSHDSLKISNGKWCWWSHDKMGGVNALEYLIKVENMKFPDAVQLINEQCGVSASHEERPVFASKAERPKTEFLLPTRFQNNRRVTAYLLSRGIDMAILDYCFQHGLLYEAADYHNAVFVGYDDRIPRYATLRGTLSGSSFKRDVTGSNKRFCFSIDGQDNGKLNVFECAIDALSYLTQVKMQGVDWRQESVLSLGGVYQSRPNEMPKVPTALQGYRERGRTGAVFLAGDSASRRRILRRERHQPQPYCLRPQTAFEQQWLHSGRVRLGQVLCGQGGDHLYRTLYR